MDLKVVEEDLGAVRVVAVSGELDVLTAPALRERISEALDAGVRQLVVDLTEVGFIDSSGLGMLVGRLKAIRVFDGAMALVVTDEPVLRNFRITGLDGVFDIHPSRAAALAAVGATEAVD